MLSFPSWNILKRLLCVACAALLLFPVACSDSPDLRLGYVGGLTGRTSGLGVAGRDGMLMAIEEQNKAGGIHGRQIELIVKDDQQNAEVAKRVVGELIDAGVCAIVGHMTSSMSVVTQPLINQAGMVMISPTTKTDLLNDQDDYFFRVTAPLTTNASRLAEHAATELGAKTFAVVYDKGNQAFTGSWLKAFQSAFVGSGGEIAFTESYTSSSGVAFIEIAERVIASEPEGLLILASAMDTALLSQQLYKLKSTIPIFTSEWSFTSDLINFGGRAVQGVTSFHSFNADSSDPEYLDFAERFKERFGYIPSFATVLSYDATRLLIEALLQDADPKRLKQTLLAVGEFQGLQSKIRLNRYGDVERQLFRTVVEDSKFHVIE